MKAGLTQKQNLKLNISPQLIQGAKILQMNIPELYAYIESEAMENPAIDIDKLSDAGALSRFEWLKKGNNNTRNSSKDDERGYDYEPGITFTDNSLKTSLIFQLSACHLSCQEESVGRYLISCIDSKGFLNEDAGKVAERLSVPIDKVEKIMQLLRSFSPPGICSRDIRSFIAMQLQDCDDAELCIAVVAEHLDDLAHGYYQHIASEYGVSVDKIQSVAERVRSLNPFPSAGFPDHEQVMFIYPDVQVSICDSRPVTSLCHSFVPHIIINDCYLELYHQTHDREVKAYLESKIKSAEQLIQNVAQRDSTLLRCAEGIVQKQINFFTGIDDVPVPMSMSEIADLLDINISTVSRAVKGKYIQCRKGVLPVRFFFSRELNAGKSSVHGAKALLYRLIESENKQFPLSDQQLCELMAKKGITLSRRAVAKYRSELGIPSTLVRKV